MHTCDSINLYFQDESRFGLKTHTGKRLTAQGVKPIVQYQHKFKSTYLWGSYSPIDGDSFVYEIEAVNLQVFQAYLNALSQHRPDEHKIMVIDNAGFHSLLNIEIPDNISLINIPPYSPELNPCERIWQHLKAKFSNQIFQDMNQLKEWLYTQVRDMKPNQIKSITHHKDYINAFISAV